MFTDAATTSKCNANGYRYSYGYGYFHRYGNSDRYGYRHTECYGYGQTNTYPAASPNTETTSHTAAASLRELGWRFWGARASRVLVSASRRNELPNLSTRVG